MTKEDLVKTRSIEKMSHDLRFTTNQLLWLLSKAYLGPSQIFMMELLAKAKIV